MISQYYFLFALAGVAVLFATVQDFRRREVADWLNFSFIAFALAYRAFYSAYSSDWMFLVNGVIGFGIFFALANLFYYGRVFAGGDAKLLMGFGAVLPFENWNDFAYLSFMAILVLFVLGAIYSMIYTIYIAVKNKKKFAREFSNELKRIIKKRYVIVLALLFLLICLVVGYLIGWLVLWSIPSLFALWILFVYLRAVDKCMIKLKNPGELQEGDWLKEEVIIGKKVIKKSIHGLSIEDIKMLKRAGKKVLIKDGIPFTPAFLASWLVMVFAFLAL